MALFCECGRQIAIFPHAYFVTIPLRGGISFSGVALQPSSVATIPPKLFICIFNIVTRERYVYNSHFHSPLFTEFVSVSIVVIDCIFTIYSASIVYIYPFIESVCAFYCKQSVFVSNFSTDILYIHEYVFPIN